MTKLEDRIRTTLHTAAAGLSETETGATVQAEPVRWQRLRGPALALATMAAVLVLVGGSTLVLSGLGEPEDGTAIDVAATTIAPSAISTAPFPVPGYVPADVGTVGRSYTIPDSENPVVVSAIVARGTANGFDDAVMVSVLDSPDMANMSNPEEDDPIDLNGYTATVLEDENRAMVWWYQGERVVMVHALNGDRDLAISVAEAATVGDGDPDASMIEFANLPAGYAVIAPPQLASSEPHPVVTIRPEGFELTNLSFANVEVVSDTAEHVAGLFGSASATEIRSRDAYMVTNETDTALVWNEGDGVTVMVFGTYPESELRAIAEGLEFVSESEWQAAITPASQIQDMNGGNGSGTPAMTPGPSSEVSTTEPPGAGDQSGSP